MTEQPEPEQLESDVPVIAPENDLGGLDADLGTNAGTGADSGGTGSGTTALDAIGSDLKFDSGVADHLKIKHKLVP